MSTGPAFLGVYAKADQTADELPVGTRCHVWSLPDGDFLLKKLDDEDGDEPFRISVDDFFMGYRVSTVGDGKKNVPAPEAAQAARPPSQTGQPAPDRPARAPSQAGPAGQPGPAGAPKAAGAAPRPAAGAADAPSRKAPASGGQSANPAPASAAAPASPKAGRASSAQPGPAAAAGQSTASPAQAGRTSQESGPAQPAQSGGKPAWQSFSVKEPTAYPSSSSPAKSNEEIEEDFRTSFSLALVRLKSDPLQALADLDELASDNGPFAQEHKFMFTDCGLALRKRNHLALAMRFHQKARLLSPDDEHILFNMARVMYENGQIDKAREYLALSLEMEPGFTAGREFLEFLK